MKKFLILLILIVALTGLSGCFKEKYEVTKEEYEFLKSLTPEEYERLKNFDLLLKAIDFVNDNYYSDIDYADADVAAAIAFVGSLDRYSYMTLASNLASKSTAGIGLSLQVTEYNEYRITHVHPESPADTLSVGGTYRMRRGDYIYSINGTRVENKPLTFFNAVSAGGKDTELTLTIRRGGQILDEDFECVKQELVLKQAYYIDDIDGVDPNIGYIKLMSFTETAEDDFVDCINSFLEDDNEYLILDLRGNGGGSSLIMSAIASYLVNDDADSDKIPLIDFIDSDGNLQVFKTDENLFISRPIVVLVDSTTASASEALVSAMIYYNNAVVVGVTTYGKGTALNSPGINNGYIYDKDNNIPYAISIVVGKYYVYTNDPELDKLDGVTDNKYCIDEIGITPEYEPDSKEFKDELKDDGYIVKAIEILLED
jgi:carboxyl-terminal processing protease